jgi:hypothetical protein
MDLVAGKKRVPSPATGKIALVTFFIFVSNRLERNFLPPDPIILANRGKLRSFERSLYDTSSVSHSGASEIQRIFFSLSISDLMRLPSDQIMKSR